jgi:hypothetical protein
MHPHPLELLCPLSACAAAVFQCYSCARLRPARPSPVFQCFSAPLAGQGFSACAAAVVSAVTAVPGYGQPGHPRCSNVSVPHSRGRASLHVPPLCYGCRQQAGWPVGQCCSNVSVPHSRGRASLHVPPLCYSCARLRPARPALVFQCCSVSAAAGLHLAVPGSEHVALFQPQQDRTWQCQAHCMCQCYTAAAGPHLAAPGCMHVAVLVQPQQDRTWQCQAHCMCQCFSRSSHRTWKSYAQRRLQPVWDGTWQTAGYRPEHPAGAGTPPSAVRTCTLRNIRPWP